MNEKVKNYCMDNVTDTLDNDEFELADLILGEKMFVLCTADDEVFVSDDNSLKIFLDESLANDAILSNDLNYVEVSDVEWLYQHILKVKNLSFITFIDSDFTVNLDIVTYLNYMMFAKV